MAGGPRCQKATSPIGNTAALNAAVNGENRGIPGFDC